MKKVTHFIETYRDSNGVVRTGKAFPIEQEPYQRLGNKVSGWQTILISKICIKNKIKSNEVQKTTDKNKPKRHSIYGKRNADNYYKPVNIIN